MSLLEHQVWKERLKNQNHKRDKTYSSEAQSASSTLASHPPSDKDVANGQRTMLSIYPSSPWEDSLFFFSACYHYHRLFPARTGNCFQGRRSGNCLKKVLCRVKVNTLKVQNTIGREVVDNHMTMLDDKKKLEVRIGMLTVVDTCVLLISKTLKSTR